MKDPKELENDTDQSQDYEQSVANKDFKELGNEAYQAQDYKKAVALYTEGIEHEPTNAILYSNRSAAYLNLEDYDKAKRDADMCIQLDPSWSKVSYIPSMFLLRFRKSSPYQRFFI